MKLYLSILASYLTILSFAQDTFQFKNVLNPNSSYLMSVHNAIDMSLEFVGIEENNYKSKTVNDIEIKTISQNKDQQGNVPFELFYTKVKSKSSFNGEDLPSNDQFLEALSDVKIKGIDKPTGRVFTGYEGLEENKKMFDILFDSFKNLIVYPKETFKIGQTHQVTNSISSPLPGGMNLSLDFNTAYTLTKIENGKAFFDVIMKANNDSNQATAIKINIKKYNVKGDLWVDLEDNNISEMNAKGPNVMELEADGMNVIMSSENILNIQSKKL